MKAFYLLLLFAGNNIILASLQDSCTHFVHFSTKAFLRQGQIPVLCLPPEDELFKKNKRDFKETIRTAFDQPDGLVKSYSKMLSMNKKWCPLQAAGCDAVMHYKKIKNKGIIVFKKEGFAAARRFIAKKRKIFKDLIDEECKNPCLFISQIAALEMFWAILQKYCPQGGAFEGEDTPEKWERYIYFKQVLNEEVKRMNQKVKE